MAYTYTPTVKVLELYTLPNAVVLSDTNLDTHELNPFPATAWTGNVLYAYLDIIFPNIRNTNAASNHSDGFTVQLKDSGATWRDAIIVPTGMWLRGSTNAVGDLTYCGTTNISTYVQNNAAMTPRIENHKTDVDAYYWYGIYNRLRLYFEGG